MAAAQHILLDSTQSLATYPPVLAQASAATVRVQTPAQSLQATGDSATIDTISVLTTAAAAEGATSITVASAAWVKDVQYFVATTTGETFVVESQETETGTTLTVKSPLPMAVPSSSTVKGWRITHALTAAETAQAGEAHALFTATLGGVSYTWAHQFRIVRRNAAYSLNAQGLATLAPRAQNLKPSTDKDFTESIRAAWERYLLPSLEAKQIHVERIFSWGRLEAAHAAAVEMMLLQQAGRDPAIVDDARKEYLRTLEATLAGVDFWYDAPDEAAARPQDDVPLAFTIMRAVR